MIRWTIDDLKRRESEECDLLSGWAAEEIERLTAIVDRLQKTRDGVSVTPGMRLWHGGTEWTADSWAFRRDRPVESVNPESCYSSKAAEKAREQ